MSIESAWQFFVTGNTQEALNSVNKIIRENTNAINNQELIRALLLKIRILVKQGLIREADVLLKSCEEKFKSKKIEKIDEIDLLILESELLWHKKEYENAERNLEEAIRKCGELTESQEKTQRMAQINFRQATIQYSQGNLDQAIQGLVKSKKMFEQVNDEIGIGRTLNNIGLVYERKGDVIKATNYYQQSLEIKKRIGDKEDISRTLHNLGRLYRIRGDFKKSLELLEQSLKFREEIGSQEKVMATLNEIGAVYLLRGEVDSAEGVYLKIKGALEKRDEKQSLIPIYINLGIVNEARGKTEKARSFYTKALEYARQTNDWYRLGYVYHNLIELELRSKNQIIAKDYLDSFERLSQIAQNKNITDVFLLTKATVLKASPRVIDKAEAQKTLLQLIKEKNTDASVTLTAMIHLCDLLFINYEVFGDKSSLEELKDWLRKIGEFAKAQESAVLLIQSLLLKAKLAIIEEEINEAESLLSQAQAITEEKGLLNLGIQVSALFDELSQVRNTQKANNSSAREEKIHFSELLQSATSLRPKGIITIETETPIAFLIIREDGSIIFYQKFRADTQLNDQIFFSFIPLIMSFSQEMFKKRRHIERIMIGDHSLLINKIGKIQLVYIIQGSSFTAVEKLEAVGHALRSRVNIWEWLHNNNSVRETPNHRQLQHLINEIFQVRKNQPTIEIRGNETIENEEFPSQLMEFKTFMHPIKLVILNVLFKHYRFALSDMRKILGISWGNLDTHLTKLKEAKLVEQRTEFIESIAKEVLYLTPKGSELYDKIRTVLQRLFH